LAQEIGRMNYYFIDHNFEEVEIRIINRVWHFSSVNAKMHHKIIALNLCCLTVVWKRQNLANKLQVKMPYIGGTEQFPSCIWASAVPPKPSLME